MALRGKRHLFVIVVTVEVFLSADVVPESYSTQAH